MSESMHYVGLDVHQKRSSLHILDHHGQQVKRLEIKGGWSVVLEEISRQVPRPFSICYEASCGYGYLYEKLAPMARHVSVAHPGQLRLIYKSKKKNDQVDAAKLAKLLYLDMVPQVHVPKANVRAWRALITYREKLMNKRVGVKNQIRALLRGLGIMAPAGQRVWSGKGMKWLKEQKLEESDALRRDMAAEELQEVNARIRRVEKELNKRADGHPGVALLKTIPGVGVRTAEAMAAYLDDVTRFSRNKKVGSYLGLVPCQDASAGRDRLGHITRDGPAVVRKLLSEASWQGIRRSGSIKSFFERVMGHDPDRKKIALVATAHHLARVMAAMLRSGEAWRERTPIESENNTEPKEKKDAVATVG
ncbi:MAG TPA: IS110 family transposase [Tepidisphaeraceae bacterium]|nr:IS110 family transposase [Tepidisphaeraceae bacterium]